MPSEQAEHVEFPTAFPSANYINMVRQHVPLLLQGASENTIFHASNLRTGESESISSLADFRSRATPNTFYELRGITSTASGAYNAKDGGRVMFTVDGLAVNILSQEGAEMWQAVAHQLVPIEHYFLEEAPLKVNRCLTAPILHGRNGRPLIKNISTADSPDPLMQDLGPEASRVVSRFCGASVLQTMLTIESSRHSILSNVQIGDTDALLLDQKLADLFKLLEVEYKSQFQLLEDSGIEFSYGVLFHKGPRNVTVEFVSVEDYMYLDDSGQLNSFTAENAPSLTFELQDYLLKPENYVPLVRIIDWNHARPDVSNIFEKLERLYSKVGASAFAEGIERIRNSNLPEDSLKKALVDIGVAFNSVCVAETTPVEDIKSEVWCSLLDLALAGRERFMTNEVPSGLQGRAALLLSQNYDTWSAVLPGTLDKLIETVPFETNILSILPRDKDISFKFSLLSKAKFDRYSYSTIFKYFNGLFSSTDAQFITPEVRTQMSYLIMRALNDTPFGLQYDLSLFNLVASVPELITRGVLDSFKDAYKIDFFSLNGGEADRIQSTSLWLKLLAHGPLELVEPELIAITRSKNIRYAGAADYILKRRKHEISYSEHYPYYESYFNLRIV